MHRPCNDVFDARVDGIHASLDTSSKLRPPQMIGSLLLSDALTSKFSSVLFLGKLHVSVNVIRSELQLGQERAIRFIEMFIASRYTGPGNSRKQAPS
jgi:hypothetical protein